MSHKHCLQVKAKTMSKPCVRSPFSIGSAISRPARRSIALLTSVAALLAAASAIGYSGLGGQEPAGSTKMADASPSETLRRPTTLSQPRRITFSPANEDLPAWGDGETIAYVVDSQQFGTGAAIGLVQADGFGERVAAFGPPSVFGFAGSLSWVGNGGQLMLAETVNLHEYLTFDPSKVPDPPPFLRVALDGSDEAFDLKLSTIPVGGWWVKASRDGSTVAWRVSSRGRCGLTQIRIAPLAELNGQEADSVGFELLEGECQFPQRALFVDGFSLTPAGSQLVISLPPEGEESTIDILGGVPLDLYLYNTDGSGAPVRLTDSGEKEGVRNYLPEVSPDGTKVLFSRLDGTVRIYSVNLDGTELTQMTERQALAGSWSPTAQQIAFSSFDTDGETPNTNIYVLDLAGGTGPLLPPKGDPAKSHILQETNQTPGPQADDGRLIFERQGNRILIYRHSPRQLFRELLLLNPHPVTGVPQDFVLIDPEVDGQTNSEQRGFLSWVKSWVTYPLQMMPKFARTEVNIESLDSNFRPKSAQIRTEFIDGDSATSSLLFNDRDGDGISEAMTVEIPLLPDVEVGVELFESPDGTAEYMRLTPPFPLDIHPASYFPLGDTNGDGVPDSPALDFDGDGVADPDLPLMSFLAGPSNPGVELKLHFAQFGDGSQDGLNIFSQITLFNLDVDRPAQVKIILKDDDGNPLSVDLNGEVVQGETDVVIPAGGLRIFKTDGEGPLTVGSAVVCSDRALAGVILFGGSVGVAGVGISQVLSAGLVAPMETDGSGDINTGIAVMNVEQEPNRLQVTLGDAQGSDLATAELTLPASGHQSLFVNEFPWQTEKNVQLDFSNFRGLLTVSSSGRVAATVIQTRPGEFATLPVASNFRQLRFGLAASGKAPQQGTADLDHPLYFAQFGDGSTNGAQIFSQLILLNLSDQVAEVKLLLRDDAGQGLVTDLEGEVVSGEKELRIEAGGLSVLRTDGQGDLITGSVSVFSDQPLAGVILFGGSVGVAGVGSSALLRKGFEAPVESDATPSVNSGIAVMNVEEGAVTLKLRLHDQDGRLLARAEIVLPGRGHRALFINEIDWQPEPDVQLDFSNFIGLLKVDASGRTAGTVIQTRPGVFATQPVVPGLN